MFALLRFLLALMTTPFKPMWRLEAENRGAAAAVECLVPQDESAAQTDELGPLVCCCPFRVKLLQKINRQSR